MTRSQQRLAALQSSLERTERELREAQERVIELDTERMAARTENQRLREALKDLQNGIATYLADPLRKKTYVHAEVFIELCGERIAAALSNPSNPAVKP
jgi:chromosome segregation ATPase